MKQKQPYVPKPKAGVVSRGLTPNQKKAKADSLTVDKKKGS